MAGHACRGPQSQFQSPAKGLEVPILGGAAITLEIPVQMPASRRQQFRWAMGSAQCVRKFYREILDSKLKLNTKLQAFFQLTRHVVFPLSIAQLLLLPFPDCLGIRLGPDNRYSVTTHVGPTRICIRPAKDVPEGLVVEGSAIYYMLLLGEGISLSNSIGFFQGLVGFRGTFERTPKYGIVSRADTWKDKKYPTPFSWIAGGEIALVCVWSCSDSHGTH